MQEYFECFFPNGHDKAVLLVDDDDAVRSLIKRLLNQIGFSNVLLATNGKDALEIYFKRKDEIIMIVTDLKMPLMNGDELFWHLKEEDANVRVLLCSGHINGTDVNALLKAGLRGFLQKPFTSDDFSLALANALL